MGSMTLDPIVATGCILIALNASISNNTMTTLFNVDGMKCGGCKSNVEKALAEAVGVQSVRVDLDNKTVHVEGEIDTAEISQRIRDLGFQVTL